MLLIKMKNLYLLIEPLKKKTYYKQFKANTNKQLILKKPKKDKRRNRPKQKLLFQKNS